jgi:acetolactate synthase-1/3 small subunit
VLIESGDPILEVSRTGRMVMRRGHHTSRVLEAMRVAAVPESEAKDTAVFDLVEEESNFQK